MKTTSALPLTTSRPRRPPTFCEINGENSSVVAHIFEVIAKLAKEQGMESYRVVSNIGEQAGQSVHHLHFHVLSGRDMTWPPG